MEEEPDDGTAGALEDVAYLARSLNRLSVLDALTSGSHSRRDLTERRGVARTTVGRIVNELQERGWVERTTDGGYTATPTGVQVVAEFTPVVDSMVAVRKLGETVAWFQATEPTIDLQHLQDATVLRPESDDLMAPTEVYLQHLREASEFSGVVGITAPVRFEEAMRDGVVERGLHVDHVISESVFSYVRDRPDRMARRREYVEAGATVYRYDGEVPCNVFVLDETVYVASSQSDYGEPYTVIVSDADSVRTWAHEVIETHKADAERLDADAFG